MRANQRYILLPLRWDVVRRSRPVDDGVGIFLVARLSRLSLDPTSNEAKIFLQPFNEAKIFLQPCADEAKVVQPCTLVYGCSPRHQRTSALASACCVYERGRGVIYGSGVSKTAGWCV